MPAPAVQSVPISGTVESYNRGPKGNIEGLMIKSADRSVQVNLPPDLGAVIAQQATPGTQVQINGIPQLGMPDHPVYDLYSMKAGDRQFKVAVPGDERFVHIEATVTQINYARRGEVNGALLDNGDFVHLGPEAAASFNLQPGQKLTIDGTARPMLGGEHQSIEAIAVNGQMVRRGPRPGDDRPGPGPRDERGPRRPERDGPPPRGPEAAPPPPGPDAAGVPRPNPPAGGLQPPPPPAR
jgi:hypothetical protein